MFKLTCIWYLHSAWFLDGRASILVCEKIMLLFHKIFLLVKIDGFVINNFLL